MAFSASSNWSKRSEGGGRLRMEANGLSVRSLWKNWILGYLFSGVLVKRARISSSLDLFTAVMKTWEKSS